MLLIDKQVQEYVRILLRLHRRSSTPQEYHARVSRKSSTKGKRLGHTPTIHTPLPFANALSFARPLAEKLYTISPPRAYKNFYNIFFQSSPLSFRWHHSLAVPTLISYCLTQSVISKKIVAYTALK
jgi:hypothetical protein